MDAVNAIFLNLSLMPKFHQIVLTFGLLLAGFAPLQAQDAPQKPLRIGLGLLGTTYVGDLNTNGDAIHKFYPGVGLSLQFASEKLISPQLNTGFGKFIAQDRNIAPVEDVTPNTFVETPYFFADFRLKARFLRQKDFQPYFSLGLGLLGYTPRDQDGNNLLDNTSTRQDGETYGSLTAGFPLSLGAEVHLSQILALGVEYTYRLSGTDYLDNIGELGLRNGNDKMHSLLLSLYITFDPDADLGFGQGRGKDRR